jgi:rRNA small subunit pseudouridine methyltransferase Nep1
VHFYLVESLSNPLFKQKKLKVYVSTIDNKLIIINEELRIPKSYFRFERLMITIFNNHKNNKSPNLIELRDNVGFNDLIQKIIRPDLVLGFSVRGTKSKICHILRNNVVDNSKNYCFVVGGFQRGHFSETVNQTCSNLYSISPYSLESHVVIARVLYECENYTC